MAKRKTIKKQVQEGLEGFPERQEVRREITKRRHTNRAISEERRGGGELATYHRAKQFFLDRDIGFTDLTAMGVRNLIAYTGYELHYDMKLGLLVGYTMPGRKRKVVVDKREGLLWGAA
jgi:hypothetical protein